MIGFGGYPGFGMTFSIMRIMVPVIFVLVFGIIIVAMVRGICEWNKNNHSPKQMCIRDSPYYTAKP